ncbi:hypothetical protein MKY91_20635 [Alkalicoccobacillus gibsonii]|uniref:Uncharacterized protein n=1 Tax=Alkalicoccobacillus gibsonii TaxID=79881 RepID=A0ABU9VNT4_9BACI
MLVKISELFNSFYVTVETKRGIRYHTTYASKPTPEEVKEDFEENQSAFMIIK